MLASSSTDTELADTASPTPACVDILACNGASGPSIVGSTARSDHQSGDRAAPIHYADWLRSLRSPPPTPIDSSLLSTALTTPPAEPPPFAASAPLPSSADQSAGYPSTLPLDSSSDSSSIFTSPPISPVSVAEVLVSGRPLLMCNQPDCSEVFNTRFSLKRYLKTHSGERPWRCDMCNRSFTEKATPERHARYCKRRPYPGRLSQSRRLRYHSLCLRVGLPPVVSVWCSHTPPRITSAFIVSFDGTVDIVLDPGGV